MTPLLQKTKQTNRKFYGKWLYKASLTLEGCALLRTKDLDELENFCLSKENPESGTYSYWRRAWENREKLLPVVKFLKQQNRKDYSLRIERSIIDFYTNDSAIYNDFSNNFSDILRLRFEPAESTIDLLNSNQHFISVDKLPKGKYNYRVYLLPHKMKHDKEEKQRYLDWLSTQVPKVTCTPAIKDWFIKTDWNWDRRYILVEDEATLLMLKLRNSDVVGRIYNFVVSDK